MSMSIDGNFDALEAYNTATAMQVRENLAVPYDPVNPWKVEKLQPGQTAVLYGWIRITNTTNQPIDIEHGFDLQNGGFFSKIKDQNGNVLFEARKLDMEKGYAFGEINGEYVFVPENEKPMCGKDAKDISQETSLKRSCRHHCNVGQKA